MLPRTIVARPEPSLGGGSAPPTLLSYSREKIGSENIDSRLTLFAPICFARDAVTALTVAPPAWRGAQWKRLRALSALPLAGKLARSSAPLSRAGAAQLIQQF